LSTIRLGTGDLAKYPFLNEAGEYMRQAGFTLEELGRPEMAVILDRATQRVEEAVAGNVFRGLDRYETEILTFLTSLIIVKSIGLEPVVRKFSLAEARRAEDFLAEDLKKQNDGLKSSLFVKIFEDLFHLAIQPAEDRRLYKVKVSDYLSRSSHFHENEWKLINRLVSQGFVFLDADETVRLIRSELATMIYNKVRAMTLPTLPENMAKKAESLRSKFAPRYEFRVTGITDYPPCIKHAVDLMAKGENLPHSARVMLATYMLAIGKPIDEIVEMFRNAPDFNAKVTRYQVEHLAGMKGSRTKYSVPSCEKLLNENLCFATDQCAGILNPVQFGMKRERRPRL
jgi:DNA primase large subunit